MEAKFSSIVELIEEFAEDFLSKIEKSVIKATLSSDKKLSEIYCNKINCINITELDGRYVCNQKRVTIGEDGKCFFSDIVDTLKAQSKSKKMVDFEHIPGE